MGSSMTNLWTNLPSVEPDHPEAKRSYHMLTKSREYFFRVRKHSTAMGFLASAEMLESQALELWGKSDSLELEDLLSLLEQNPPTPQLIAMIMLLAKSTLRSKSDGARGGKAKSDKFKALKDEIQLAWKNHNGDLSKKAFANRYVLKWKNNNDELRKKKQIPVDLPADDTPKRWLKKKIPSVQATKK